MANTTRSALRNKANLEVKIDKLYKVWSQEEYNDAINEALFEINAKGDGKWEVADKTTEGSSTINQQFYDQPDDFLGLKLMEFNDNELTRAEYEDIQRTYTNLPKGTPTNYYFYKNKIGLHPIPSSVGTVKILYSTTVTDLTTDLETSPYVPRFDRAIALYTAYVLLTQPGDNRNTQRAGLKLQRFNDEMIKLMKMFLYKDRENMSFRSTYVSKSQRRYLAK